MSTGLNCEIIEPLAGTWYYVLENSGAPRDAWDWREWATATGPFVSESEALDYMSEHEANPGGYAVVEHADIRVEEYSDLLANARAPIGVWRRPGVYPTWGLL